MWQREERFRADYGQKWREILCAGTAAGMGGGKNKDIWDKIYTRVLELIQWNLIRGLKSRLYCRGLELISQQYRLGKHSGFNGGKHWICVPWGFHSFPIVDPEETLPSCFLTGWNLEKLVSLKWPEPLSLWMSVEPPDTLRPLEKQKCWFWCQEP